MRCKSLRTVGFMSDGKTLSWSQKTYSKEYATFQLPCGKCLECRLNYAREWAIRCVHEASLFGDNNSFITLTYSEEHLLSDRLQYTDFQLFAKRLRKHIYQEMLKTYGLTSKEFAAKDKEDKLSLSGPFRIGIFVTGEYGDKGKRPHWHALIFNWRPKDAVLKYTNKRGDRVYDSEILRKLWPYGFSELGSVTLESAGYVARYAAKKLVHGEEAEEYEPVSKKSNHTAIGKRWIEKNWEYVFAHGRIHLGKGVFSSIPRYYEKWLMKNQSEAYSRYVTQKKLDGQIAAMNKSQKVRDEYAVAYDWAIRNEFPTPITADEAESKVLQAKFKMLQDKLKL